VGDAHVAGCKVERAAGRARESSTWRAGGGTAHECAARSARAAAARPPHGNRLPPPGCMGRTFIATPCTSALHSPNPGPQSTSPPPPPHHAIVPQRRTAQLDLHIDRLERRGQGPPKGHRGASDRTVRPEPPALPRSRSQAAMTGAMKSPARGGRARRSAGAGPPRVAPRRCAAGAPRAPARGRGPAGLCAPPALPNSGRRNRDGAAAAGRPAAGLQRRAPRAQGGGRAGAAAPAPPALPRGRGAAGRRRRRWCRRSTCSGGGGRRCRGRR
jgi:hypothetical protein